MNKKENNEGIRLEKIKEIKDLTKELYEKCVENEIPLFLFLRITDTDEDIFSYNSGSLNKNIGSFIDMLGSFILHSAEEKSFNPLKLLDILKNIIQEHIGSEEEENKINDKIH